jgi:hypothetical protein
VNKAGRRRKKLENTNGNMNTLKNDNGKLKNDNGSLALS